MNPAGFWNALGAKILLFCPMSIEVSRSAHAALPNVIVLIILDLVRGSSQWMWLPFLPPWPLIMPLRMTSPHSLLLTHYVCSVWVLLLDALRLQAMGCPPSPISMGCLGCLVAGTL